MALKLPSFKPIRCNSFPGGLISLKNALVCMGVDYTDTGAEHLFSWLGDLKTTDSASM
jgi:hypothetical protein